MLATDEKLELVDGIDEHYADDEDSATASYYRLVTLLAIWQIKSHLTPIDIEYERLLHKLAAASGALAFIAIYGILCITHFCILNNELFLNGARYSNEEISSI